MTVIEMVGVSNRVEEFRIELLDSANQYLGTIEAESDSPPVVVNDVDRPIRRVLDGMRISPNVLADINTISDRLRPMMTIDGTDYPLGVFLFADVSRHPYTFGIESETRMVDQMLILDQPIEEAVGYDTGTLVSDALLAQAAAAGIVSVSLEPRAAVLGSPLAWPAGRTRRTEIFNALCSSGGYLGPYFSNPGTLTLRSAPDLAAAEADFEYGVGVRGRVYDGTITESDDLLEAPNRYIALDSSATDSPIVGHFDIPAASPHSAANRNFVIATLVEVQGLANVTAAEEAARLRYSQDSSTYTWLSFDAAPDPRHDTFDLVKFEGNIYREQGWRLRLHQGGPHQHDLRRLYF